MLIMFGFDDPTYREIKKETVSPSVVNYTVNNKTTTEDSMNFMLYLSEINDNLKQIRSTLISNSLDLSNIFHTNSIKHLAENPYILESISSYILTYLDAVDFCSLVYFYDHTYLKSKFIDIIVKNRSIKNPTVVIVPNVLNELVFDSEQEALDFISNNPLLLGLYIYSFVDFFVSKG